VSVPSRDFGSRAPVALAGRAGQLGLHPGEHAAGEELVRREEGDVAPVERRDLADEVDPRLVRVLEHDQEAVRPATQEDEVDGGELARVGVVDGCDDHLDPAPAKMGADLLREAPGRARAAPVDDRRRSHRPTPTMTEAMGVTRRWPGPPRRSPRRTRAPA
jgi:hypothetical protein